MGQCGVFMKRRRSVQLRGTSNHARGYYNAAPFRIGHTPKRIYDERFVLDPAV